MHRANALTLVTTSATNPPFDALCLNEEHTHKIEVTRNNSNLILVQKRFQKLVNLDIAIA